MSHTEEIDNKEAWAGGTSPFGAGYGKLMMWFFLMSDALSFTAFLGAYGFFRHNYSSIWPTAENVFTHFPFIHGHQPLIYVALMTFILIMSSVTMVLAVEAGQRMDRKAVIKWMFWTIIGGLIFVGSQAWEWGHFIHGSHDGAIHLSKDETGRIIHDVEADTYVIKSYQTGNVVAEGPAATEMVHKAESEGRILHGANMTENEYGTIRYANFFFFITGFHGFHVFSGVIINLLVLIQVVRGAYDKRGHFEMVEKAGLYWHFVDLVWVFVFTFFYLV